MARLDMLQDPPIVTDGMLRVKKDYERLLGKTSYEIPGPDNVDDIQEPVTDMARFNDWLKSINTRNPFMASGESTEVGGVMSFNDFQDQKAQGVVDLARRYVGGKYTWGGKSPSTGFDCSGLIQYVYGKNGIELPRTVRQMEKAGTEVKGLDDVKVGDIICLKGSGPSGKHVKLVSRIENGQIYTIEAKGKKYGIVETPLDNTSGITTIRRFMSGKTNNEILDFFMSKGLTKEQAQGIYGNLMQESGMRLSAVSSDGHNSYGIAQWTGDRKSKLFNMFGRNPSLRDQLEFTWWELNHTHKSTLAALKKASSVEEATKVFMDKYERPSKRYANYGNRLKYARQVS